MLHFGYLACACEKAGVWDMVGHGFGFSVAFEEHGLNLVETSAWRLGCNCPATYQCMIKCPYKGTQLSLRRKYGFIAGCNKNLLVHTCLIRERKKSQVTLDSRVSRRWEAGVQVKVWLGEPTAGGVEMKLLNEMSHYAQQPKHSAVRRITGKWI